MLQGRVKHLLLKPLSLIIILSVIQLVIALLSSNSSLIAEESMWQYIGRNWFTHGMVPYTGGIDNKSPFIFAIFGLSDKLFGVNYWFPRLLGTVFQSISLWYVYKIAKQISGERSGIFAVTIYGLSLMWRTTGGTYISFTESYEITFIIIAFYIQLTAKNNKGHFISGVLAGIGIGFKLSACFGVLALFLSAFKKSKISPIIFSAGVLVSVLLIAGIFYVSGISLHDFVVNGFADNFGAGSPTDHNAGWKLDNFLNSFFYAEIILFYPFVITYLFMEKKVNFLVIWLVCSFACINIVGMYARNHFKDMLPVLSLMSGISLACLTQRYAVPFKPVIIMVWLVFFPKIVQPFFGLKQMISPPKNDGEVACAAPFKQPDEYGEKQLGLWLKNNIPVDDEVYIAGFGGRVQAYSERISPTVYFNITQTQRAKQVLFSGLAQHKPAWILVPEFPEYQTYVQEDVRKFVDTIVAQNYSFQKCMYGYGIYRKTKP